MVINSKEARKKLTFTWFIGCAILLLFFITQQLLGKFEDKASDAWAWISPNIFPFISLVSGGYLLDRNNRQEKLVDRFYYRLTMICSLFYFVILILIVTIYPLSDKSIIDYYKSSTIFLVPIQSVVTGVIGIFFIKGNNTDHEK